MARSARAVERLLGLDAYRQARSLMVYVAFRSELLTEGLIRAALAQGKVVTVPKVERQSKGLLACRLRSFPGPLRPGAYGILEPVGEALELWPPEQLDLVVVPGLAFDPAGHRLGYGGGYYDRFLAGPAAQATAIGMAFREQVLAHLPVEPLDRSVSAVVTDEEVFAISLKW